MNMARELTKKQRIFVKEYVQTGNGEKSALASYDTTDPNTARNIASENLTRPNVKDAIELALIKHDISLDNALIPVAEGLKATKQIYNDGELIAEYTDHTTRLKASGMALNLLGVSKGESTVHFHQHLSEKTYNL